MPGNRDVERPVKTIGQCELTGLIPNAPDVYRGFTRPERSADESAARSELPVVFGSRLNSHCVWKQSARCIRVGRHQLAHASLGVMHRRNGGRFRDRVQQDATNHVGEFCIAVGARQLVRQVAQEPNLFLSVPELVVRQIGTADRELIKIGLFVDGGRRVDTLNLKAGLADLKLITRLQRSFSRLLCIDNERPAARLKTGDPKFMSTVLRTRVNP